ncbi:MAG: CapA family protein [Clostridium sp.]|uniref:CapA family protein n=1 Tax=Clostridium sp. TaxID=1506 RepID=UPI0025BB28DF|nr:CapA family protein [Clostridium sp.]MBS5926845.1 CapA family protein [Clostridium sp.]
MKNKKKIFSIILTLILSFIIISCNGYDEPTTPTIAEKEDTTISVLGAGDVLMHMEQVYSGYDSKTNTYNYDNFFAYVKDYISTSDLAICNSETTYLGNGHNFSGYPKFNSPKEILDSIKNAGFDMACSSHNHINDMGDKGIESTAKLIKEAGLDLLGVKNDVKDKNYIVKDIKGIKIGITNYTYSTIDKNGYRYINGLPLSKEMEPKINLFSDSNIENDINNMKSTYDNMLKDGADFTIFYIHWGNEYQLQPSTQQEKLANMLNSIGVNVIFGSHPHVVQPIRRIKNDTTGNETLVCYSLGNFVSNQRFETMGNLKSEDGLMVKLFITKDSNNKVKLTSYETEPTWVYKYVNASGKTVYNILPTNKILESNDIEGLSEDVFNRVKNSNKSTNEIINS